MANIFRRLPSTRLTSSNLYKTKKDDNAYAIGAGFFEYTPPVVGGSTTKVNVGGIWKDVVARYVNIGGVWKAVLTSSTNIGGVWKLEA